ncbi:hypothetical protein [Halocynthiibacter styelae]|uniref:Uncharacterized protein n=1 Tax=Halocynthiibacter styelae TaxID=2761955 RepID=A0A8J7J4Z7_9RHOB|nr:hypothetical protein [Paenihalocynthiibacter styelae]MBI1493440.1 hypothetical protein [Paenihalocynthiibacter styelae]
MTEDTLWLTMPLTSKTAKAQIVACIHSMPSKYCRDHNSPRTKTELIEFIKEQRAKYWDERQAKNRTAAQRAHSKAQPNNITAAECNNFLRSLPAPEFA